VSEVAAASTHSLRPRSSAAKNRPATAYAPERIDRLLAGARPGTPWRAGLGLPEPSPRLADAIESLGRLVRAAPLRAGASSFDALLTAAKEDHFGETDLDDVVRRTLLSMLEERRTRQPTEANGSP
jgi:hypothetical protein